MQTVCSERESLSKMTDMATVNDSWIVQPVIFIQAPVLPFWTE